MSPVARKTLARYGPKGRTVRVLLHGDSVRVQWREGGALRVKSYPNTPAGRGEAKQFAQGFAEVRDALPTVRSERRTVRAIWTAYMTAEFPHMRPRTQQITRDDWRLFETFVTRDAVAEDVGVQTMAAFRAELEKDGANPNGGPYAVNTIRRAVHTVRRVYRWAQAADLIASNKVYLYRFKVAKDKRPVSPDEYRADVAAKILAQLDPTKATQWRAHTALTLCRYQGVRQNAALHLRWEDIDWTAGVLTWRAAWDKLGKEWTQPLREPTRAALAALWARQGQPATGWVIPAGSSKNGQGATYTAQSLWAALRTAERNAGVPRARRRATHGFRRGLLGDLVDATGDVARSLEAIGDSDVRMAKHYLKQRGDQTAAALHALDTPDATPEGSAKDS